MLAELLQLMEGPARLFPPWGLVHKRETQQLARVLQSRSIGRSLHTHMHMPLEP
jgi:hypothetical protein